ncbi:DUF1257 domain-containing protein [Lignipirellula cremea]|uniref:DUF1257 domain-containing protein n=1 Tax=Lignipirellula cremea TaxID=2528010 RepID=A0A518DWP2_9BACT|nr:DUF1257 domain-containing protein [Lignipirellula cremea]QDU96252.1 hypothetical protein Pla8534_40710 [Lignipirellula cremea]
MSHIVQIQTEVRDLVAVRAACERLKLPSPVIGSHRLYQGTVIGLGVELPGWRYRVVCDLVNGQLRFDNFGGRWGEQVHLDQFLQNYAVERVKIEARKKGHSVTEQSLEDGSVKLTVNVGGGV